MEINDSPSDNKIDRVFLTAPLTDIRRCGCRPVLAPEGAKRLHGGCSGLVKYSARYCSTCRFNSIEIKFSYKIGETCVKQKLDETCSLARELVSKTQREIWQFIF